ncbi:uncharacterized protein LOC129393098 [Pan paniscus]|uniref:uncharacterized protein LOC129393098 n=1 Tax=Pan paniscus TaxID=9597 RepID=UPI002436F73F|nr:uncharacterized protein LOC129393098 [Pan paniscus]
MSAALYHAHVCLGRNSSPGSATTLLHTKESPGSRERPGNRSKHFVACKVRVFPRPARAQGCPGPEPQLGRCNCTWEHGGSMVLAPRQLCKVQGSCLFLAPAGSVKHAGRTAPPPLQLALSQWPLQRGHHCHQKFAVSPKLECSGAIKAHHGLERLRSTDIPDLASPVTRTTGKVTWLNMTATGQISSYFLLYFQTQITYFVDSNCYLIKTLKQQCGEVHLKSNRILTSVICTNLPGK